MKTINRELTTVNIPKHDNKLFAQVEWKGLSDNRNFISVDQNTFADCDNVYVDRNGILSSRPAIKQSSLYENKKILKVSVFDNVQVFETYGNDEKSDLYFVVNGEERLHITSFVNMHFVFYERRIYIFTDSTLEYVDIDTFEYNKDPSTFVYTPITEIVTNGIVGKNEQYNELNNSYIRRYKYAQDSAVDFTSLVGENVNIKIRDDVYNIPAFKRNNERVILSQMSTVNDSYVSMCENGSFITYDGVVIRFTTDGIIFEAKPYLENIIGNPYLSQDGSTIFAFKADGLYAISVMISDDAQRIYPTWTKIKYAGDHADDFVIDTNFVPAGEFDSDDVYCYIVKTYSEQFIIHTHLGDESNTTIVGDNTDYGVDIKPKTQVNISFATIKTYDCIVSLLYTHNDTTTGLKVFSLIISSTGEELTYDLTDVIFDNKKSFLDAQQSSIVCYISVEHVTTYNTSNTTFDVHVATLINNEDVLFTRKIMSEEDVYSSDDYKIETVLLGGKSNTFIMSKVNKTVITDKYHYTITNENIVEKIDMLYNEKPIYNFLYIAVVRDGKLFSNAVIDTIYIDIEYNLGINFINITNSAELDKLFLSCNNDVYILDTSQKDIHNKSKLYLPSIHKNTFNYKITNLHPLSKIEMGIFFENGLSYATPVQITMPDTGVTIAAYTYTRSKLPVGCKRGADVVTSLDGKFIIFSTSRGLAYMSYQELVASNEQTLAYLSDTIFTKYDTINAKPVKILTKDYWIICYNVGSNILYILDIRNESWWQWSFDYNIQNIVNVDNDIVIIANNKIQSFVTGDDYTDNGKPIKWFIKSQKLHLHAINNYKTVRNITVSTTYSDDLQISYLLSLTGYSNIIDTRNTQVLEYDVNEINTFVQRVNMTKVNALEYILAADTVNKNQEPLRLASVLIKFEVQNQVR